MKYDYSSGYNMDVCVLLSFVGVMSIGRFKYVLNYLNKQIGDGV